MRKLCFLLAGIVFFQAICVSRADVASTGKCTAAAVADSGFETSGCAGKLACWNQLIAVKGAEFVIDKNEKHSGGASYRISSSKPGGWGYINSPYVGTWEIKPGAECRLTAWMKGEHISSGTAWVSLKWFRKDGSADEKNGVRIQTASTDFGWTELRSDPVKIPEGADRYIIQAGVTSQFTGTVWMDDIAIETVEPLAYPQTPRGLIGSWTFDEGEGTTTRDGSGCGNDGLIHNPDWQKDAGGRSRLLFDKDTYVEVPHSHSLILPGSAFSFEVVFKPLKLSGHQVIFFKGYNSDSDEYVFGLTNSSLRLIGSFGGGGGYETYVPLNLKANEWNHLTVSGDGRAARIYLNGRFCETWMYSCLITTPAPLLVGFEPRYRTSFDGYIAELKLYNYPLSREEIRNNHEKMRVSYALPEQANGDAAKASSASRAKTAPAPLLAQEPILLENAVCRPDTVSDASGKPAYRENVSLYVHNTGSKNIKPGRVIMNGKSLDARQQEDDILWYVWNPVEIPAGGYGELTIRFREAGMAPDSLSMEFFDAGNNPAGAGNVSVLKDEPLAFKSIGFEPDLKTMLVYCEPLRGDINVSEVFCNGVKTDFRQYKSGQDRGVNLLTVTFTEPLKEKTPLFIKCRTSAGTTGIFCRVSAPFLEIGMYRCNRHGLSKTTMGKKPYEHAFGEWAAAYVPMCQNPGDKMAVPAWLTDCAKHYINTIAPGYFQWGRTTEPPKDVIGYLNDRNLRLVTGLNFPEVIAYTGTSTLYLADEPAGVKTARSLVDKLNKLRDSCASALPCKVSRCALGVNTYDFSYADQIDFAAYPIGASAPGSPFGGEQAVTFIRNAIAPKPVGYVPQAFRSCPVKDFPGGWSRFPSADEERLMVYSALAGGAKSITYFCYALDTWEPVEGVGTAALIGIPEAVSLWDEIGRINIEMATAGHLLASGCLLDRYEQNSLLVSLIGAGRDTLIGIIVNKSFPDRPPDGPVTVKPPAYFQPAGACVVSHAGTTPLDYTVKNGLITFSLNGLQTAGMFVFSSDPDIAGTLQKKYTALREAADAVK